MLMTHVLHLIIAHQVIAMDINSTQQLALLEVALAAGNVTPRSQFQIIAMPLTKKSSILSIPLRVRNLIWKLQMQPLSKKRVTCRVN
jgi:hypothetical protein